MSIFPPTAWRIASAPNSTDASAAKPGWKSGSTGGAWWPPPSLGQPSLFPTLQPTSSRRSLRMKVVLFCGGMGMRIREYSDSIPKPMVPIGYRPLLWHVMKYYAHYGYKDFILCLGYKA